MVSSEIRFGISTEFGLLGGFYFNLLNRFVKDSIKATFFKRYYAKLIVIWFTKYFQHCITIFKM